MMTINQLKKRVAEPGSPFRYLYKWKTEIGNRISHREIYNLDDVVKPTTKAYAEKHSTGLDKEGFSPATGDFDPNLSQELLKLYRDRLADPEFNEKKLSLRTFMTRISTEEDLDEKNILVRFALQEKVLAVAAAYLGQTPYLSCVHIFQSTSTGEKGWKESQLWHLDREDARTVKLWVYLTDVANIECGPFTFLDKGDSAKVANSFFPTRLTDDDLERQNVLKFQQQIIGPELTAFYVDSSLCYHQGSRVIGENVRAVYEATFVTHSVLYKINNGIRSNPTGNRPRDIALRGL